MALKPHRFKFVEVFTPDQLNEVETRLIKGEESVLLAIDIQTNWNLCLDKSLDTLARALRAYRLKYLAPKVVTTMKDIEGQLGYKTNIRRMDEHLVVLEDLYQIIDTQKNRIQKMLNIEEHKLEKYLEQQSKLDAGEPLDSGEALLGRPFDNQIRMELQELVVMLRLTVDIQLDTGILRRVPKTLKGTLTIDPDDPSVKKFEVTIQERNDLVSRAQRIGQLLQGDRKLIKQVEKDAVTAPPDTPA
jgi:hypothetical protein